MTAQDKELFSQLYDRNYKRLLYAAIRIAHNPFTAEELTNEAFTILLNVYYVIQALFKLKTHCRCPPFYDKESFFDYQLPRLRALRPYCFNFTSIYSILQQELANSSKKT